MQDLEKNGESGRKKRIYQVAKELKISNEALIEFLQKHKFKARNHMALLTPEMLDLVYDQFKVTVADVETESDFRKKIQEKRKEEEAHMKAVRQEIDEVIELSKTQVLEEAEEPAVEKTGRGKAGRKAVRPETAEEAKPTAEELQKAKGRKKPVQETEEPVKAEKKEAPSAAKKPVVKIEAAAEKPAPKKDEKPKRHLKRRPGEGEEFEGEVEVSDDKKWRKKEKFVKYGIPEEVEGAGARRRRRKKKRKKAAVKIDEKEIEAQIKETFAKMGDTTRRKRYKKEKEIEEVEVEDRKVLQTTEFTSVSELANLMNVPANEVIQSCMTLGQLVTINQRLDRDMIIMVADEFGYEAEFLTEYGVERVEQQAEVEESGKLEHRPAVVTIMGHVDHGKTSLLDYIRESNIIAGESGGITQHIGAYEVTFKDKKITFLDTPGHEAFTAMRARGAQVTDIVVLVVAADDSVMPQTVEAINHARAAGVPIIVAINKIDKPGANPNDIKKRLADHDVLVEDWGGKVQCAEISAKTGQGIDRLLEQILLEAEILDVQANPDAKASAVIVEAKMDKGRGIAATVLVQKGTLRIGDIFVAGQYHGRVHAMFNERNQKLKEAPPSTPVQVLGSMGIPQAGDQLVVVDSEQEAREISIKRQQLRREQNFRQVRRLTLDQISKRIAEGQVRELSVIIKGDVDGSVEAISDSLMDLATKDVAVRIIHKGVGAITESDVLLAEASQAVVLGFHITPTTKARDLAVREDVDIRLYSVIYDLINDVKLALSGLLEPEVSEKVVGVIEIREVFKASKVGKIAGCFVQSGKLSRNDFVRLIRDGKTVHTGKISTLKRFKDDVREVALGFECGLTIENFEDIRVGDLIEAYERIEKARSL